ncbi:MAG TPA: hypothetical protein VJ302_17405 [Blastocatellia bacterium]|nr:hypothetical protein [Blastocatellia bacterium]
MKVKPVQEPPPGSKAMGAVRNWGVTIVISLFVLLYGAALLGWIKPVTDERLIMRLEPIIFVIVGYCFGRLPAQQNEQTLREELSRQTQKADAAQHAKEQAQQAREALEEKIKNVRVVLASSANGVEMLSAADDLSPTGLSGRSGVLRQSVAATLNILDA